MDPVTALGVASGILTFLTFSSALLKVGHGVCVTSSGRNEQNMTREVVVDETKAFLDQLMPADDSRLAGDQGLCRLVEESRRIAKDLMNILAKVKPKKSGTVANLRSAIRHTLSQPDMDDLEKRLDQCRSQLGLHLNSGYFNALQSSLNRIFEQGSLNTSQLSQLQTNVDRLRKGVVIESLSDEAQDQFRRLLGIQQESVDRTCQQVILKALRFPEMRGRFDALDPAHKKTFRWLLSDDDDNESDSDSITLGSGSFCSTSDVAGLDDEADLFSDISDSDLASSATRQINFNEDAEEGSASGSLWSKTSDNHKGSEASEADDGSSSHTVSDLDNDNYEYWEMTQMRKSARDKLLGWLSSSDGIFHICGKLGSGKSTLMKYLFEHKRTRAELELWAGGSNRLVSASFFFWKPGSKLQKSLPGLYRSLLHDVLAACPELIPSTLPKMWERATKHHLHSQSEIDISPQQIQTAFDKLIRDKNLYAHHRFCFFIDGLDEYEQTTQQDYKSMLDMFIRWTTTSGGNVKLCVSSREYNVFMNAFDDQRRLRVHDLTLYDIRKYVEDRLGHLPEVKAKIKLAREIATKAHGIFFWVALVVRSMREAMEDGMSVVGLTELLDSLPTELEDLFHHILTALDKEKLRKASMTFDMLDTVSNTSLMGGDKWCRSPPLTLLAYSFLDHYKRDKKFAIRDNFLDSIAIGEMNLTERLQLAAKQIRANCGGLLEASTNNREDPAAFDYTHRSVPEYLEAVRNGKRAGPSLSNADFDAGDAASSLILAQFRAEGASKDLPADGYFTGLAILRLSAVAIPDQAPYEFLECLDSLSVKAKLHDTEHIGSIRIFLCYRLWATVEQRSFPGDGAAISTMGKRPSFNEDGDEDSMDRPIFAAMIWGFNEYVVWKLLHDSGIGDTPAKSMALVNVALQASHPPWDALFESAALSSRYSSGFLAFLTYPSAEGGGWNTSGCPWFSSWRYILLDVTLGVSRYVAKHELQKWRDRWAEMLGQAVEQFLRRGVASIDSDLEFIVTPVVDTSTEGSIALRVEKLAFRFGDGSLISCTHPGGDLDIEIMAGGEADLNLLQWCSDISGSDIAPGRELHVTFRQLLQVMELPNQAIVFSLLDSRDALAVTTTAGEVGGPEMPEEAAAVLPLALLAEQDLSTTTARKVRERTQSLWDRLDTNLAMAFGSGVLVSLLVASIWMRYSGTRGQL